LAKLIAQRRTLLVLDGLELLENPPGPQEGRLREPSLQALLRELAAFNPGLSYLKALNTQALQRGTTLIELSVVIAVLLLLVGVLFIGIKKRSEPSRLHHKSLEHAKGGSRTAEHDWPKSW
jgi:prepilin-type N-terminal cleavage/methylation domain-containing protein